MNNGCEMEQFDSSFGKYLGSLSDLFISEEVPGNHTFVEHEGQ